MDISKLKQRLDSFNPSSAKKEKIDYEKIFWRPKLGKHVIRIVPSAFNPDYPFTELKFHYGIGKYPMIALSNFGKQDPVEEFINELKKSSDRDNWVLAGKLTPKTRVYAPVVVRGEEHLGVRLWGFGITVYKTLMSIAADEDIGDYTDIQDGYDMVVEMLAGNPYPSTSVRIRPKSCPISEDARQVKVWLAEQPNPIESYKEYDYDFIKTRLQEYLFPEGEESTGQEDVLEEDDFPTEDSPVVLEDSTEVSKPQQKSTELGKTSLSSKFDDIFED